MDRFDIPYKKQCLSIVICTIALYLIYQVYIQTHSTDPLYCGPSIDTPKNSFIQNFEDSLSQLFTPLGIDLLNHYCSKTDFNRLITQEDFVHTFIRANTICTQLNKDLHNSLTQTKEDAFREGKVFIPPTVSWFNTNFQHGILIISADDTQQLTVVRDFRYFRDLASQTPQKKDDQLINDLFESHVFCAPQKHGYSWIQPGVRINRKHFSIHY